MRAFSIDVNAKILIVIYQYKTGTLIRKGLKVSSMINFLFIKPGFLRKLPQREKEKGHMLNPSLTKN
jgi:hypothetical protein